MRLTFLKVCLHDATARRSAPVDSTVHAPRSVQCQKIAYLFLLLFLCVFFCMYNKSISPLFLYKQ